MAWLIQCHTNLTGLLRVCLSGCAAAQVQHCGRLPGARQCINLAILHARQGEAIRSYLQPHSHCRACTLEDRYTQAAVLFTTGSTGQGRKWRTWEAEWIPCWTPWCSALDQVLGTHQQELRFFGRLLRGVLARGPPGP